MNGFESQQAAERQASAFIEAYRVAFESFDAGRIADCYTFPLQLTSDADGVSVVSVPTREAWIERISHLLAAYRTIGVHSAHAVDVRVTLLSANVALARVQWSLRRADRSILYQFHAGYTLVRLDEALRIAAIVFDEAPHLRAAVAQAAHR